MSARVFLAYALFKLRTFLYFWNKFSIYFLKFINNFSRMGAPVMVEIEGETDPLEIARKELKFVFLEIKKIFLNFEFYFLQRKASANNHQKIPARQQLRGLDCRRIDYRRKMISLMFVCYCFFHFLV